MVDHRAHCRDSHSHHILGHADIDTSKDMSENIHVVVPMDNMSPAPSHRAHSQQAYLTFCDVDYTIDVPVSGENPTGRLQLLHSVQGYATPGMCIALMGSSGAGKTTLLDVLARRKTQVCWLDKAVHAIKTCQY